MEVNCSYYLKNVPLLNWVANIDSDNKADLLLYAKSDKDWILSSLETNNFKCKKIGNTTGLGNLADGRPIWIGNFSQDRSQVLIYFPGDSNWWLGTYDGNQLQWKLSGNTRGFGQIWASGRPFWIGKFSRADRSQVLFYFPGNKNWHLGTTGTDGVLTWTTPGNTSGFGQIWASGRPFWIGDFNGDGRDEVLFYFLENYNWHLGTISTDGVLTWTTPGNTRGFGQIWDGRPFWIGKFSRADRSQVLFYFPRSGDGHLGTYDGNQLQWQTVMKLPPTGSKPVPGFPPKPIEPSGPRTVLLRLLRTTQDVDAEYAGGVDVLGIVKKVRNKGEYYCHLTHRHPDRINWSGASFAPSEEKTYPWAGMQVSGMWKGSHTGSGPMPATLDFEIEY